jgi:hypothetical protein
MSTEHYSAVELRASITRDELAILLDNEAFPAAADRIRGGREPRNVLGELRPFVPRYPDGTSREAVATFQAVCRGELNVA